VSTNTSRNFAIDGVNVARFLVNLSPLGSLSHGVLSQSSCLLGSPFSQDMNSSQNFLSTREIASGRRSFSSMKRSAISSSSRFSPLVSMRVSANSRSHPFRSLLSMTNSGPDLSMSIGVTPVGRSVGLLAVSAVAPGIGNGPLRIPPPICATASARALSESSSLNPPQCRVR